MNSLQVPPSPCLPNEELDEIPNVQIPASLGAELNLDDDDDDDDGYGVDAVRGGVANESSGYSENGRKDVDMTDFPEPPTHVKSINNFKQFEHPDSIPSTPDSSMGTNVLSCSIPKDPNYITPMGDFSDPTRAPIDLINPFGANNTLASSDPIPMSMDKGLNMRRLSDLQEQKLGDYIDDKLLLMQRGFVKYLASKDEAVKEGLTWPQLVCKVDEIVEFLWYAISHVKGVPVIYHSNILTDASLAVIFQSSFAEMQEKMKAIIRPTSFILVKDGANVLNELSLPDNINNSVYVSYLIRLLGDLIDYIVKYELNAFEHWILLLRLTAKMDNVLSIIIDYSTRKSLAIISTTEKVRIASIVQRSKITMVELFDHFVRSLGLERVQQSRSAIDSFQMFIGEAYEGLVDRTSL